MEDVQPPDYTAPYPARRQPAAVTPNALLADSDELPLAVSSAMLGAEPAARLYPSASAPG